MKIFLVMIALFYAFPLWAGDPEPVPDDVQHEAAAPLHTLSPVIVHATAIESSQTTIGGAELDMLPSATGSITEALKGMSQIQYDYERQSSLTVGEIAPPRISISGAKPYENNFMIDGMSVSNTLNPAGFSDSANQYDLAVGGGDSDIFYDTNLIDSIRVYSSNVPAQYGGFVGGVVDARLRTPRSDRWSFTLAGRYTEDSWFNLRGVNNDSNAPDNQPKFRMGSASISMEGPVSDQVAVLFSAARRRSIIPLKRELPDGIIYNDRQKRTNDNFLARIFLEPQQHISMTFDVTYALYEETRWRVVYPGSDWTIYNPSWRVASKIDYRTEVGVLAGSLAYLQSGYSRDSLNNYRYVLTDTGDPSQNDRFGGVGDAKEKKRQLSSVVSYERDEVALIGGLWTLSGGLEYGYQGIALWNEAAIVETDTLYSTGLRNNINTRTDYAAVSQSDHLNMYGAYLQIEAVGNRLQIRPGIRIDYDDFSHNTDISPRFKGEYDLLANGMLRLVFGANRYYGSQLKDYAFKRWRPNTRVQTINFVNGTQTQTVRVVSDKAYKSDNLKTPYSDELTGGFVGEPGGFTFSLIAVQRKHKQQLISMEDSEKTFFMTNNGRSSFEEVTLTLSREIKTTFWGNHNIALSGTKSRTKTFNGSYLSEVFIDDTSPGYDYDYNYVFYDGNFIARSDLPAENFNAPWTVTLTLASSFFNDRFRVLSLTRWRDSATGLQKDERFSDDTPDGTISGRNDRVSSLWITADGNYSDAYKSGKISGGSTTDITAEFDAIKTDRYHLTLILEGLNIFNGNMQTSLGGDALGTGDIHGRGFYLGARMTF